MLSWIPFLGPIIQGLSSIFTSFFNEKVQLSAIDANKQIEYAKVSQQIIATTNDDIALRIMRDAAVLPVVVWSGLIGWDTIIAYNYPQWMFRVPPYPPAVGYLPYIVLVFLFGNIGLNIWRGK